MFLIFFRCATVLGRHEMPVEDAFFFNQVENVTDVDFLNEKINQKLDQLVVYVSGLTVVTTAIITVCIQRHIHLTLMHFDAEAKEYFVQDIL